MCLRIIGVILASTLIASSAPGVGYAREPDAPRLRADHARIRTSASECKADMDGVFEEESGEMAAELCKLRATHNSARARLRAALAELVATYKDFTNHDHAKNLPDTIEALQQMVSDCLRALESQQWCHNFACATWPEENAILCETKAAEVADAILRPGLGSVSLMPSTP